MNGRVIQSERDYVEVLYGVGPGRTIDYQLLRAGNSSPIKIPVVIGKRAVFSTTDFYRAFIAFT
jgi:S1-C subfamily serine protease